MPTRNRDLHGSAPDKSPIALLLIDVINALDFADAERLLPHALKMADKLQQLKARAQAARIPIIYVNDNFGRWRSDFSAQVEHCLHDNCLGRPIVEKLKPTEEDYFVLKPKHSGFYATTLQTLLTYLHVNTLILTGIAGNICVLFTANDAYMRDYRLFIPRDGVASNTQEDNHYALEQMHAVLKADLTASVDLDLSRLAQTPKTTYSAKKVSDTFL